MPKIKTDFVISGERQYKQAILEINRGLGVLDSEMKKVTAEYQDNAHSMEALTAKGDVLERQLISQKEKVDKLREALAHAVEQYGEGSKTAMEYQKSLNNAEAGVADLEHAIRENNKALEEAEKGMQDTGEESEKLSLSVKDLASQFGVNLPGGLDKALKGMQGFSTGSVAAVAAVAAAMGALVKVEKEMLDLTREAAASADEILTLSQITGLNTDTIQEMKYAANLIDVSFETIKGSMTKLKNNMQDARDGNEKLTETFRTLGVEIENADGSLRDAEEVFYACIDALGEIENATERDTVAMDLFGKKAEDLNPLIIQGSDRLRELAKEAENTNYVIGEEGLEALGAVDDAYQRMQNTQESIKNQMAEKMAPAVEQLYTSWTNLMQVAGETLIQSGIIDGLAEILKAVAGLLEPVDTLANALIPQIGESVEGIKQPLSWVGALLASFADLIDVLNSWNFKGFFNGDLANALGFGYSSGNANHYQTWKMMQDGTYEEYVNSAAEVAEQEERARRIHTGGFATGTMHFVGGRALVGENGPEVVDLPEGTRIWNNQNSRSMGGDTYNITIDAKNVKEFNDIVRIVESLRVVRRMQ